MIKPGLVAFDVDGVVADTMRLFLEIARCDHHIEHIRYADITNYDIGTCLNLDESIVTAVVTKIFNGSYSATLFPIKGAPPVLKRLSRGPNPVVFITARPYVGPIANWIRAVVDIDDRAFEIIATGSFEAKSEELIKRGIEWFVEDRLETCFSLYEAGIKPILFRQPWNRKQHPFVEVANWQALAELIDFPDIN